MAVLLRILIVIPFAYVVACFAAGLTFLAAGVGFGPEGMQVAAYWPARLAIAGTLAFIAGAFAAIPAFVVTVAAEVFRLRSLFFFALLGAAIGLAAGVTLPDPADLIPDSDLQNFLAAGLVGGVAYWLFAGRSAGFGGDARRTASRREQQGPPTAPSGM